MSDTLPSDPDLAHGEPERASGDQRDWLQITLSSIGDGVITTDASGRVNYLNPVAEKLTGWKLADAVGRAVEEVFHIVNEKTRKPVDQPVRKVVEQGLTVGLGNHTVLIARDGSERPIDDSAAPIKDDRDNLVGVVLIFRDITERKRLEKELKRHAEELAEADRRKDEFLAMLGHELRNPLAPIRNALYLVRLSQQEPRPEVRQAYDIIERQVENLVRLVDDLLDVGRITSGKIQLRKERVDLSAVVARAIEGARPLIDARRHTLEVNLPEVPVPVEADPVRLAQVLWNLLNNAAKYTPEGDESPCRSSGTMRPWSGFGTRAWASPRRCCPGCLTSSPRWTARSTAPRAAWASA